MIRNSIHKRNYRGELKENESALTLESTLNLVNATLLIASSTIPLLMAWRAKPSPIRILSILLTSFILVHGIYHLVAFLEVEPLMLLGEAVIEPLSWLLLFAFSIYYARRAG